MNKHFLSFVIKLALVMATIYLAYQGLFWFMWEYEKGPKAYDQSYQHALNMQYSQLADPNRENEIIFFGSSTCAFGIDVNEVKEVTGMDAQIFGMESAVTPAFLTDELKRVAKPGDTICCVFDGGSNTPEDFVTVCCAFESDKEFLERYWSEHAYNYKLYKSTLLWRKLYALTAGDLVEAVRTKLSSKEQVYLLSSFDDKGNMNLVRDTSLVNPEYGPDVNLDFSEIDPELIDMLNEFNSWCVENDIRFVVAYNMHPEGSFINSEDSILEYHEKLSDALDAEVITTPYDGLLPADHFYNSYFHLNDAGAKEYSRRIAEKL